MAGETGQPLWRPYLLEDHIRAKLEPIGLGWVNFHVMRRTHASLGHHAKVDPKVSADQRGHGIGVALDVYIKASMEDRVTAAKQLEDSVLTKAVRARPGTADFLFRARRGSASDARPDCRFQRQSGAFREAASMISARF